MNLTDQETDLIFSIMRDLSGEFDHSEVRRRVGHKMLELLKADYFASYVWDDATEKFVSCVQINMSDDNLRRYESHFQFHDPITPTLQNRRRATPVSEVMRHDRLVKTEFFNDFLKQDGLCYGMNYFAFDRGDNIGDLRIWRGANREDFTSRDAQIVDAVGPSLVNALIRARSASEHLPSLRFAQIADGLGFTAREAEVADLLTLGLTDDEICAKLGFSKPTLRSHIAAIFRKSGLNRRTQLAQYLTEKNHHL
ncbi:helix-turn-helix transcriptional regulator [Shimia sp.]|uniref:helix-turn-helix transcriptional regulator n=1 Tax=Shimia sp. TaxID=1954381 RepID=UPI003297BFDE